MVGRLKYTENNKAYYFDPVTFYSEIAEKESPNGKSMVDVINEYFDFSSETKYNRNCHYSKKFQAYVLPLKNHLEEKNYALIKNGKVFNPNGFCGFAIGDNMDSTPFLINEMLSLHSKGNWIFLSEIHQDLLNFVVNNYQIRPKYESTFQGLLMQLLESSPKSWNYSSSFGKHLVRISEPTIEARTVLINLLADEDYIEFGQEILIRVHPQNVEILINHCLTFNVVKI